MFVGFHTSRITSQRFERRVRHCQKIALTNWILINYNNSSFLKTFGSRWSWPEGGQNWIQSIVFYIISTLIWKLLQNLGLCSRGEAAFPVLGRSEGNCTSFFAHSQSTFREYVFPVPVSSCNRSRTNRMYLCPSEYLLQEMQSTYSQKLSAIDLTIQTAVIHWLHSLQNSFSNICNYSA